MGQWTINSGRESVIWIWPSATRGEAAVTIDWTIEM